MTIDNYLRHLPKAELHIHIEGSLEPELMFKLAKRNKVNIPYNSVEDVRAAYQFTCLQDFLNIYYAGAEVLQTEKDFYDLTYAYLQRVHEDGVKHVEVFFDPQTHTSRGIEFGTVILGINAALIQGEKDFGVTHYLIMCILRHLSEAEALETLQQALPYKELILGIGLDSSEKGNPPEKFTKLFAKAKAEGLLAVAHAGEEGPCENIENAIDLLHIDRIDHGNSIVSNEAMQKVVKNKELALTMCPLSNLKLQVLTDLNTHPAMQLHNKGIIVTINSDDPAYFGGYINENYLALAKAQNLKIEDITELAINSFKGSFLPNTIKSMHIDQVRKYYQVNVIDM